MLIVCFGVVALFFFRADVRLKGDGHHRVNVVFIISTRGGVLVSTASIFKDSCRSFGCICDDEQPPSVCRCLGDLPVSDLALLFSGVDGLMVGGCFGWCCPLAPAALVPPGCALVRTEIMCWGTLPASICSGGVCLLVKVLFRLADDLLVYLQGVHVMHELCGP